MRQIMKVLRVGVLTVAVMGMTFSVAQASTIMGRLIELSSVSKSITIEIEGAFAEKRIVTYSVADDARWHICLKDKCIEKKGIEGYKTVNEYAQYGDYGIPHQTYGVVLDITGDKVTALEVQIVTRVH